MRKKAFKEGFTLIELSLAMVFISLLSLAIVLIIINTISSYRRGITLSEVNSTGSQVVDDMRVAVQNSSATSIEKMCSAQYSNYKGDESTIERCKENGAEYFVTITRYGSVRLPGASSNTANVPLFGAFCTGSYSYIWNSGYFFTEGATANVDGKIWDDNTAFTNGTPVRKWYSGTGTPVGAARVWYRNTDNELVDVAGFRLLKIKDESREICASKAKGGSGAAYEPFRDDSTVSTNVFDITYNKAMVIQEEPVDLLASGDTNDMALYSMEVSAPVESTSGANLFYAGSFILGTTTGGPDIKSNNGNCAVPGDVVYSNFDYCAINKFSFAAQANGG